ncbi:hypothetical protein [Pseudomonas sp. DP-17]|uniref:hypothetical protein n=1 Tax=Pseudomonas sp. DP-17 TaxID=1580486 RepID=UPI001EFBE436|nr:hypothetical protein [Pseudomonas sp. DP-17]MCG8906193.1 hypothetical protein [Pseudomonas sp. DP-17]
MAARTGQRFIDGMASDEALFRYLMDNAIAYKDSLQLSVGVGLSAEQVAALTHDIVWLEEAEVNGERAKRRAKRGQIYFSTLKLDAESGLECRK